MEFLDKIENLYYEELNRKFSIENKNKYITLIEILKNNTLHNQFKNVVKVNSEFYGDLNVFGINGIFSKINFTSSIMGTICLQKILFFPLNKITKLQNRQNFIKSLITNTYTYQTLEKCLQEFQKLENDFLWFYQNKSEEHLELLKNVFFSGKWKVFLNDKIWIHRIISTYNIFISPLICISSPIFTILVPFITLRYYYKFNISIINYFKILKQVFRNMSFSFNSMKNKYQFWSIIGICFSFISYIHSIYQSCRYSYKLLKINKLLYQKIKSLKKILEIGLKIIDLLKSEYCIQEREYIYNLPYMKNINNINNDFFQEFRFLNKILDTNIIYDKGNVIWSYQQCEKIIDKFLPIVNIIGEIDAHISITKLYKTYQDNNHSYNFSEFLKGKKNYIKLQHVWHPLIHVDKVVSNSIRISQNKNKTVLITGPNAGGKSTIIKSIVLSAYLSQTITFAACKKIKLTPFDVIESYFNVPDVTGYKSMFEAELYRAKNYIDKLYKNPELNSLIVLDEIFNSTSPLEGISCSYSIIQQLNKISNNFSLITTHYDYLTSLDKYYNISNYHVKAIKSKDFYKFPYKIYRGGSKQNIALELLRNKNFNDNIINEAIYVKNKLKFLKMDI